MAEGRALGPAPAARSLASRRVPVEELDDDAIGVGDLKRALAPGLLAQTCIPASSRARDAKPSAAISCRKPKWLARNAAEAGTSATLRDTAEAVICTGRLLETGDGDDIIVLSTLY
jgi:hypothetical protein